jgi:NAD(P)H-dependent FMN reductase
MKPPQKALLLVGSPKPGESTSASLGAYLFEGLEKHGVQTQTLKVAKAVRSEEATEDLYAAVAEADLIVLSFPLYVDCLPGPAIRALELIAARRAAEAAGDGDESAGPAFVAICQSGFAEAEHSAVAIETCRHFCRAAGFEWAGGLVMPEGGMLNGQPLIKMKGVMRATVGALDLAADALAAGTPVPEEAIRLMAKPAFPRIAYRFTANWGWLSMAKKQAGGTPLEAQPYA